MYGPCPLQKVCLVVYTVSVFVRLAVKIGNLKIRVCFGVDGVTAGAEEVKTAEEKDASQNRRQYQQEDGSFFHGIPPECKNCPGCELFWFPEQLFDKS